MGAFVRAADWVDYEQRFELVSAYVSEHLSEPLDLITLSQVAGFSPKHWHRVYTAAFGESLSALVRRLRMQRASSLLANSTTPIAEIAKQCGYPNLASFTRAFAASFGMPPARYRLTGTHTEFRRASTDYDVGAFDVEIREIPSINCFAVAHHGSYFEINEAFAALDSWYVAQGWGTQGVDPYERQLYGVFLSDPSSTEVDELRSLACATRQPGQTIDPNIVAAAGVFEYTIEGGDYAVLTHTGPYAEMPAKYEWFFGCWVMASGSQLAERPNVEKYVTLPQVTHPAENITEMWLPL